MEPLSGHKSYFNRRDALALWHSVTLTSVLAEEPDLTTRQTAILTAVYLEKGPHTVRSLSAKLGVTKAVITRGIDTLSRHGFVQRLPDPRDKRSVIVGRTAGGANYLNRFAEHIRKDMKNRTHIVPVRA